MDLCVYAETEDEALAVLRRFFWDTTYYPTSVRGTEVECCECWIGEMELKGRGKKEQSCYVKVDGDGELLRWQVVRKVIEDTLFLR